MKLNTTNSNHQKSFYGKAVVAPVVGGEGLLSYGDLVAATGPDGEVKRKVYWMISGEGELGTWERVETTPRGIKIRLTRERCGGDRWARAYESPYETQYGQVAGYDVEDGSPSMLPDDARADIA